MSSLTFGLSYVSVGLLGAVHKRRLQSGGEGDCTQGCRQKIFQGGANGKKDQKLAKNNRKIALFTSSRGRPTEKKDRKIAKKGQNIVLLSLYLLYLYHV